jgi:hypothetical protein
LRQQVPIENPLPGGFSAFWATPKTEFEAGALFRAVLLFVALVRLRVSFLNSFYWAYIQFA